MPKKVHPTSARDIDPAALYGVLTAKSDQARKKRVAAGTAGYSDLDEAGRRAYKARKQAERRARIRQQQIESQRLVFNTANVNSALLSAVMYLISTDDPSMDGIVRIASGNFSIPEVAEANIRAMAKRKNQERPRRRRKA